MYLCELISIQFGSSFKKEVKSKRERMICLERGSGREREREISSLAFFFLLFRCAKCSSVEKKVSE